MIVAGESSGDRIAAPALHAAKALAADSGITLELFGIGGDEMLREGVEIFHHVREMSVIGFVEVARRFRFFRSVFREMASLLRSRRPDVLLLIDYPGFNIRLARSAKKLGIRVVYYVSPQVWAWHASRVEELKKVVDEMLVIFPFEKEIYTKAGTKHVEFVGHPLVERIEKERARFVSKHDFAVRHGLDSSKEWLLVFPGSRSEEVRRLLPVMAAAAKRFATSHNLQPILVVSHNIEESQYQIAADFALTRFRNADHVHELMHHASLGILKSGTTTLEAALLGLPGVICYRTHPLTFAIGKRLVKLKYIGLANIVLGHKLYPELLQRDLTEETIVRELELVDARREAIREELSNLSQTLRHADSNPSTLVAKELLA